MTENTSEREATVTDSTSNNDRSAIAGHGTGAPVASETTGSKRMHRVGWIASGLPVLFLLFDAIGKVVELTPSVEGTVEVGYPEGLVVWIGIVLLGCTVLYVLPRTAVLGAISLTGYLGGATAAQVRLEDPWFLLPVLLGVLLWGGLYLRDDQLRALVPVRKGPAHDVRRNS